MVKYRHIILSSRKGKVHFGVIVTAGKNYQSYMDLGMSALVRFFDV